MSEKTKMIEECTAFPYFPHMQEESSCDVYRTYIVKYTNVFTYIYTRPF